MLHCLPYRHSVDLVVGRGSRSSSVYLFCQGVEQGLPTQASGTCMPGLDASLLCHSTKAHTAAAPVCAHIGIMCAIFIVAVAFLVNKTYFSSYEAIMVWLCWQSIYISVHAWHLCMHVCTNEVVCGYV
jgi:hypothetical protein